MSPPDPEERAVVCCVPVGWTSAPPFPSRVVNCVKCGAKVWISAATETEASSWGPWDPWCASCAAELIARRGADIMPPSPGQLDELRGESPARN